MSRRETKRRPLKKVSTGDLRERISFYTRSITSPGFDSHSFTQTYTLLREVWASVATLSSSKNRFDDVNVEEKPTHQFKTRFWSDVTPEKIIKWKSENYKILSINDPEERNEYLFLKCKVLGDDSLEANR